MFGSEIGIDLGTSSVLIYIKGQGITLQEPSVVAINKNDNKVIAIGREASRMIGKAPSYIDVIRPLRDGVISNYSATESMLKHFIQKAVGKKMNRKPKIAVCVPSNITEVEKKAVKDVVKDSGARESFVIEEPVAAAIGSGIDITRACGSMVVDIGAGTTDIAIISLGGTVVSKSLKVAGDSFDEHIIKYVRKEHNIIIGEKTAENLKINIGTAYERSATIKMSVVGQNIKTGLPNSVIITSDEILKALKEPLESIINAVFYVLDQTPPELASDVYERGIVMTGGGALLYGLDKFIKEKTGVNTVLVDNAIYCVVVGTGKYIEYVYENKILQNILKSSSKMEIKKQKIKWR